MNETFNLPQGSRINGKVPRGAGIVTAVTVACTADNRGQVTSAVCFTA